jgi:hypothetical protein
VLDRVSKASLAAAIIAGVAIMLTLRALPPPQRALEPTPVVRAVLDDPGSPAFGSPGADVTVVAPVITAGNSAARTWPRIGASTASAAITLCNCRTFPGQ